MGQYLKYPRGAILPPWHLYPRVFCIKLSYQNPNRCLFHALKWSLIDWSPVVQCSLYFVWTTSEEGQYRAPLSVIVFTLWHGHLNTWSGSWELGGVTSLGESSALSLPPSYAISYPRPVFNWPCSVMWLGTYIPLYKFLLLKKRKKIGTIQTNYMVLKQLVL